LAQFQQYVTDGQISYFIAGGGMGGGGSASSAVISSWVREDFTSTTVGGATVFDLTEATAG
jgi:hypothetical protein